MLATSPLWAARPVTGWEGGVLVQQVVHLLLQFIFGGGQVVLLQGDGAEVLRQGHIVQRFDAAPIAVFVQTIAVIKGLVVEVGNRAKLRADAEWKCTAGRSAVGLLVLCQHETGKMTHTAAAMASRMHRSFLVLFFKKKYLHKNRPDAQQKPVQAEQIPIYYIRSDGKGKVLCKISTNPAAGLYHFCPSTGAKVTKTGGNGRAVLLQ